MKDKSSSRMPPQLQKILEQLQQRFEPLAPREKQIITIVVLAAVVMLAQLIALDPVMKQREVLQKQLEQLTQDLSAKQMEQQTLAQAIAAGPKRLKQQQLDQLKLEVKGLDDQITTATATMIPPRMMTDVLREVMQLRNDLELVSMENLEPQPLLGDEKPAAADAAANPPT